MKLIYIEASGGQGGRFTRIRRQYTNPDESLIRHTVRLYPDEVVTYMDKDSMFQAFEQGIHHLVRP